MILTIIVPVFNEEKTIQEILNKLFKLKLSYKLDKEIVVINDGSTDSTASILKRINRSKIKLFEHRINQGKGAAIRTGISKGKGDIFIIQDADLEYNPEDFNRLVQPIIENRTDVVYGSRFINYPLRLWGRNKTPLPIHWIANKALSFFTSILYGAKLTDMETCYKLFRRKVITKLTLKSQRFEIEAEITAKIIKNHIKIIEIPIKVKPRGYKEGKKIGTWDGFSAIWYLFKYRFVD